MNFRISKILIDLLILISLFSCRRNNLIGEWKPATVKFIDHLQWEKTSTVDLINTDSLRAILIKERLDELNQSDSTSTIDSPELGKRIDSAISFYQHASLSLNSDKRFVLINNNIFLPNVIPGWHIGDTLIGKWSQIHDSLILNVSDNNPHFTIQYLIVQQNKNLLILQEGRFGDEASLNRQITLKRK